MQQKSVDDFAATTGTHFHRVIVVVVVIVVVRTVGQLMVVHVAEVWGTRWGAGLSERRVLVMGVVRVLFMHWTTCFHTQKLNITNCLLG